MTEFKSGFAAIVGKSNVGKSTLLNRLVGEKIAIVSPKPQTSRNKIAGILTTENYQIVFEDTPGMFKGDGKLYRYMRKSWENSLQDTDIIIYVIDGKKTVSAIDLEILESLKDNKAAIIVAVNKTDVAKKEEIFPILSALSKFNFIKEIIPISALDGQNIQLLLDTIVKFLPIGQKYYDDDDITDKSERFLVAEIVREKVLIRIDEEIPHGVGVNITKFEYQEEKDLYFIDAEIYCERDNHKAIIIGKDGAMLKSIGHSARIDIEKLLDKKVFLNLFVKKRDNWRDNDNYLKDLGYDIKKI